MHLFKEISVGNLTIPDTQKIKAELSVFVENNDKFFSICELGTTEKAVQDLLYDAPPIAGNAENLGFIQLNIGAELRENGRNLRSIW